MQKRLFTFTLAGALVLGLSGMAVAQDNNPSGQTPGQGQGWGHGNRRAMDPDAQLAHMTKALDLTPDQQSQIKPLLVEHQQQMQALFQDQSLAPQDRRAKARAMGDEMHKKIDALLTDEQKQKEKAMEERMHHGYGQPGADAPAQPQS